MSEPNTVNVALIVPNTGDLVDLWGANALNPDFVALDGFIGGVQTISVSSVPVTLTAPSGTLTPGPGPTQSQNRVLKFTGTLTANVKVTLPLPGEYVIQNLTTGAFVLSFQPSGAGHIVAVPQGQVTKIWNDGTDAWLILNTVPGESKFLNGVSAVPAWIAACSIPPFLLEDGTVYNVSQFPALGAQLGSRFGGNGITTFGVPDSRGRLKLAYDGTGARITTTGCGINGQVLGAAADQQSSVINQINLPNVNFNVNNTEFAITVANANTVFGAANTVNITYGNAGGLTSTVNLLQTAQDLHAFVTSVPAGGSLTVNSGGSGSLLSNVPPAQVGGIWMVAT